MTNTLSDHHSESRKRKFPALRDVAADTQVIAGNTYIGLYSLLTPGVIPKVVGAGALLEAGLNAENRHEERRRVIAPNKRAQLRERFDAVMETWGQTEGNSLRDRLKRRTGTEALSLQDRKFRVSFNRMMGSLAFTAADLVAEFDSQDIKTGAVAASVVATAVYAGQAANRRQELQSPPNLGGAETPLPALSPGTPHLSE